MNTQHTADTQPRRQRTVRAALWIPGLLVAVGAAVATAHGLFEVARAAAAPPLIAGLYPLITDGLALVAYAATARLSGSGRRYAWTVVVLAAGLSGLAQASYLAHGVANATAALRFGVGAWPAIAAAIVAHLLFLIAHADRHTDADTAPALDTATAEPITPGSARAEEPSPAEPYEAAASTTAAAAVTTSETDERPTVQLPAVQSDAVQPPPVQPDTVQPDVQPDAVHADSVQPDHSSDHGHEPASPVRPVSSRTGLSPMRARAQYEATAYRAEHDELPTVARLMELADVSRGTAGEVLKTLRTQPADLHIVHQHTQQEAHS